ncbi:MAG: plasmid stabilization protein [Pimelobacter sp.]|nr:plasmid stabilization protein [Pimelobacter sp.]
MRHCSIFHHLDDWIAEKATADTARRFVAEILDHIDSILIFPLAGRAREDVRTGVRTTNFKRRTLIAYEIDESSGALVVNVLGVFHGGQDWESALGEAQGDPEGDQ